MGWVGVRRAVEQGGGYNVAELRRKKSVSAVFGGCGPSSFVTRSDTASSAASNTAWPQSDSAGAIQRATPIVKLSKQSSFRLFDAF